MGYALARAAFHLQRALTERAGLVAFFACAALLGLGFFSRVTLARESAPALAAIGTLCGLLLWRALLGRPQRASSTTARLDRLELGLLLLAVLYVAIQVTGGARSQAQPLVYLAMAFLVGFNAHAVGIVLATAAVALQLLVHLASGELLVEPRPALVRVGFILAFGAANLIFLRVEVARRQREHDRRLADEIRAMREEARDYRLIGTAVSSSGQDRAIEESKLARGAVEAIHQGLFIMLELLKKALDLQSCVLLWLDDREQTLRIKELVSDSAMIVETSIPAQAGAIGGVVKNRLLLNLRSPRAGAAGITYYAGPEQVGAFIGVPVLEGGHLRGVLCADRKQQRPFGEADEKLLVDAANQVVRAIQTERVFAAVERSKYEHERFYRASTMLNSALTLSQVYDTAFAAAREIVTFDFGALTLYDRKKAQHAICRVLGDERLVQGLEGQSFADNAGLVAMVVKNKHFLPAGDTPPRERELVVFTKKARLPSWPSLVVLPLIVQDCAIGTFVLASANKGHLSKQVREMLGVIANQVAVSIENAKMYKLMEEMATTDGLTGLPNHRTFQARMSEMLYRAERYKQPVSVVLTDIDHFKSVNDSYGHPVGDVVLKRVAQVLAQEVRKVDHVARYGGEEFVMVLEDTDSAGAQLLCERVRQQVAAQVMSSDKGAFRVTISLGIASYPTDGAEKALLVERADQALYAAKHAGRDRSVRYGELRQRKNACA